MQQTAEHMERWLRHRNVLVDLLNVIGDEHIQFQPWSNAMPLGALVIHITSSANMFAQFVKNGELAPRPAPEFQTIDDLRKIVREYTETTKAALSEISDEQLSRQLVFNQFAASGRSWLDNMVDHEIHHKGQLFTYARMVGVEKLPFFISQPPRQ